MLLLLLLPLLHATAPKPRSQTSFPLPLHATISRLFPDPLPETIPAQNPDPLPNPIPAPTPDLDLLSLPYDMTQTCSQTCSQTSSLTRSLP
jgi:hypothetical protein